MAIPPSTATDRLLALNKIVRAHSMDEIWRWSSPTESDLAAFATIICVFSEIDYELRNIAEMLRMANLLPDDVKDRAVKMNVTQLEEMFPNLDLWEPNQLVQFEHIRELRKTRNLLAHFAVRRFPEEDAFLFITLDRSDYKRVYGDFPAQPGVVLYGVSNAKDVFDKWPFTVDRLRWLRTLSDAIRASGNRRSKGVTDEVARDAK